MPKKAARPDPSAARIQINVTLDGAYARRVHDVAALMGIDSPTLLKQIIYEHFPVLELKKLDDAATQAAARAALAKKPVAPADET